MRKIVTALLFLAVLATPAISATGWSIGVGGSYHTVTNAYVGSGGVWRRIVEGWIGVGGVWQPFYFGFSPHNDDYSTPGSFSDPVPVGASSVTVYVTGGGAGGGGGNGGTPPSGAGGTAQRTIAIDPSDWGTNVSITVGAGSAGTTGSPAPSTAGSSSLSVTVVAGSFSLTGGGGAPNTGGTASGGSVNTTGGVGSTSGISDHGGASVWANGGKNGCQPSLCSDVPAAGTQGSGGGFALGGPPFPRTGGNGGGGFVRLSWS